MKFIKMPSGVVINTTNIEYILMVNAVRQPRARKPSNYTFSVLFQNRNVPTTFSYPTREEAEADYNSLCKICD